MTIYTYTLEYRDSDRGQVRRQAFVVEGFDTGFHVMVEDAAPTTRILEMRGHVVRDRLRSIPEANTSIFTAPEKVLNTLSEIIS